MGVHNEVINLDLTGMEKIQAVESFLNQLKKEQIKIDINDTEARGKIQDLINKINKDLAQLGGPKNLNLSGGVKAEIDSLVKTLEAAKKTYGKPIEINVDTKDSKSKLNILQKDAQATLDMFAKPTKTYIQTNESEANLKKLQQVAQTTLDTFNKMSSPMALKVDTSSIERMQKMLASSAKPMSVAAKIDYNLDFKRQKAALDELFRAVEKVPTKKDIQLSVRPDLIQTAAAFKQVGDSAKAAGSSIQNSVSPTSWTTLRSAIEGVVGSTEKMNIAATVTASKFQQLSNTAGFEILSYKSKTAADGISTHFTIAAETTKAKLMELGNASSFETLAIKSQSASQKVASDWSNAIDSVNNKLRGMEQFAMGASTAIGGGLAGDKLFEEGKQRASLLWKLQNQNAADAKSISDQFVAYDLQSSRSDHDLVQMMGYLTNSLKLTKGNTTQALSVLDAVSADMDSLRQRGKMWAYGRYFAGGWDTAAMAFRDEGLTEEMKTILKGAKTFDERIEAARRVGEMQGAFRKDENGNVKGMYNDMEGQVGGFNAALALLDNLVQAGTISMMGFINTIAPLTKALMNLTQGNMELVGGFLLLMGVIAGTAAAVQLLTFLGGGITTMFGSMIGGISFIRGAMDAIKGGTVLSSISGWAKGKIAMLKAETTALNENTLAQNTNASASKMNDVARAGVVPDVEAAMPDTPDKDGGKSKSLNFSKWATNIVKAGGLIIVAILMVVPILLALIAPMLALAAIGAVYKAIEPQIKDGIGGILTVIPTVLSLGLLMAGIAIAFEKVSWFSPAVMSNMIKGGAMLAGMIAMTALVLVAMLAPMLALAVAGAIFLASKAQITAGIGAILLISPIILALGAAMTLMGAATMSTAGGNIAAAVAGMIALSVIIAMVSVPLLAMIAPLLAIAEVGKSVEANKSQITAGINGIKTFANVLIQLNQAMLLLAALSFTGFAGAIGVLTGLPLALGSMAIAMAQLKFMIPLINVPLPTVNLENFDKLIKIVDGLAKLGTALEKIPQSGNKLSLSNGAITIDQTWTKRLELILESVKKIRPILDKMKEYFDDFPFEEMVTMVDGIKKLTAGLAAIGTTLDGIPANKTTDTDWAPTWGEKLSSISNNMSVLKTALDNMKRYFGDADWKSLNVIINGVKNFAGSLQTLATTLDSLPANKAGAGNDKLDWAPSWGERLMSIANNMSIIKLALSELKRYFENENWKDINVIVNGVKNFVGSLNTLATTLNSMPENTSTIDAAFKKQTWGMKLESLKGNLSGIKNNLTVLKNSFKDEKWEDTNVIINGVKNLTGSLSNIALSLDSMKEPGHNWGSKFNNWELSLGGLKQSIPILRQTLDTIIASFRGFGFTQGLEFAKHLKQLSADFASIIKSLNELGSGSTLNTTKIKTNLDNLSRVLIDDGVGEKIKEVTGAIAKIGKIENAENVKNISTVLKGIKEINTSLLELQKDETELKPGTITSKLKNIRTAIGEISPLMGQLNRMETVGDISGIVFSINMLWELANGIQRLHDSPAIDPDLIIEKITNIRTAIGEISPLFGQLSSMQSVEDISMIIFNINSLWMLAAGLAAFEFSPAFNIETVVLKLINIRTAIGEISPLFGQMAGMQPAENIGTVISNVNQLVTLVNSLKTLEGTGGFDVNALITILNNVSTILSLMVTAISGKGQSLYDASYTTAAKIPAGFKSGIATFTTSLVTTPLQAAVNAIHSIASKFWTAGARCGTALVNGFRDGAGINSPGIIQQITVTELSNTVAQIRGKESAFYNSGFNLGKATAAAYKAIYGTNDTGTDYVNASASAGIGGQTVINFNGPTFGEFAEEVLKAFKKDKEKDLISGLKW